MKKILISLIVGLLSACTATEHADFFPEASYFNNQKVNQVGDNSITFVGSYYDEWGNIMPSFPAPKMDAHKIAHVSPAPKSVWVQCEKISSTSDNIRTVTTTSHGLERAVGDFQAGKTYRVVCNLQAGNHFQVKALEVPNGSVYRTARNADFSTPKPDDANRVRFEITGKSSQNFWRLAGNSYMSVRNWNGKFTDKAELAAPVHQVAVECQINREVIIVPLSGDFQPGKTYRLACRQNPEGFFEAYVAETK